MFSNLRVFKKDIAPVWEHPENVKGGKWVIRSRVNFVAEEDSIPDDLVRKFLRLLIHMITGHLGDETEICGAQLSIRPTGLVFSVWNKNSENKETIDSLTNQLREILQADQITYQSHSDSIRNSQLPSQTQASDPQQQSPSPSQPPYQKKLRNGRKNPSLSISNKAAHNFPGDGGGASWDDIIAGSSGAISRSESEKNPHSTSIKTKSAEDIPILAKSFRLKGEFSKSLGTFYHLPPPNTCPKNDVKTKIYWYHRRKELKAQKDKMKSQSGEFHLSHSEPIVGCSTIPKSTIMTTTTPGNNQRILFQIQQQEKQFQQQHKDQLQKASVPTDRGGIVNSNLTKSK